MATASIIIRADGSTAEREVKKVSTSVSELDKRSARASSSVGNLSSELRRAQAAARAYGDQLKNAGQQGLAFGASMTAAVSLPLTALATLGVKSALTLDQARTKMVALTGSTEAAAKKWAELNAVADKSVGVTRTGARETFNQLKGLRITDDVINKLIPSLGRLNAAFNIEDMKGFGQNLNQIFQQGFERADIKEAIGRVPIFEELLQSAFGTTDGAKLKALKDSGKLTLDGFLAGLAGAIDTDPRLSTIQENLTTKLAKGFERLNEALAPLGDVILNFVVPIFERMAPYIEQASVYFQSLSPSVQTAIVAFGAFVAAIGPAIVVISGIVLAIGSIASAFAAIGGSGVVIPVVLAIIAAFSALALTIDALYTAWTTNFAGIQQATANAGDIIQDLWTEALASIQAFTSEILGEIKSYWTQNGADIEAAVRTFLKAIADFWKENGETIKAVVGEAWTQVKNITRAAISVLGSTIKLIAAVINGDWSKAWSAVKEIVSEAFRFVINQTASLGPLLLGAFKIAWAALFSINAWLNTKMFELGKFAITGLITGIQSMAGQVRDAAIRIATFGLVNPTKQALEVKSPSRVFASIGENVVLGLIVGIETKAGDLAARAKRLAADLTKDFKAALADFERLAGASPEAVATMQATERARQGKSDLEEIVKLRGELKVGSAEALPTNTADAAAELARLQAMKAAGEGFAKSLEDINTGYGNLQETVKKDRETQESIKTSISQATESQLLNLQKEISLLGVTDEVEQQRIENHYEILELRDRLKNDGFGEQQIEEIAAVATAERGRFLELVKIRQARSEALEAERNAQNEYKQMLEDQARAQEAFVARAAGSIRNVLEGFRGGVKSGLRAIWSEITGIFNSIVDSIFKKISQTIAGGLFGGSTGSSGGSSGGVFGIFRGLFGGGGSGPGGTPPIFPGSGSFGGPSGLIGAGLGTRERIVGATSSGGGSSYSQIKGLLSGGGIGGAIASMAPMLGLSLGSAVGGSSGLGQVLGGAGGLLLGGSLFAAAAPTAFGSLLGGLGASAGTTASSFALLTNPFTIAAGAALLIGARILAVSKQRRKDETTRDASMVETLKSLTAIRDEMEAARPGIDIAGLISQAKSVHDTYYQMANGLKSNKTRKIAIKDGNERVKPLYDKIIELGEIAKAKESLRQVAGERDRRLLPEFASGGFIRRNGMLPGVFDRKDDLPSLLSRGEMVLNPAQQQRIRALAGFDVFAPAGIPNYSRQANNVPRLADGGTVGGGFAFPAPKISITIHNSGMVESDIRDVVVEGLKDPNIQVDLVTAVNKGRTRVRR